MSIRRIILGLLIVLNVLSIASVAKAMPDPFATLTVWPFDTPAGSDGPIIATSPTKLIIYNTDNTHILTDVWLLLVINPSAYNNLVSITTNTSLTFLPAHFHEINDAVSASFKIPLSPVGSETTPAYGSWPGLEQDDQYDVGSLRDKLGIGAGESLWYAVADLDSSPGWVDHSPAGLDSSDPEYFTVTVDTSGAWRVLVLALGYTVDGAHTLPYMLNVKSPYTRSTLVVSELGPLLLALSPISAFGLYRLRYKLRRK